MIVWGDDVALAVAGMLGQPRGFGECQAQGFLDARGDLVAGVVYHDWWPEAGVIEITAASRRRHWLTRGRLRAILSYPFGACGAQLLVARTGERNGYVLPLFEHIGADVVRIPRLRGRDEAEIIATLTTERWADIAETL